jgi:perosamine synthetase
MLKRRLSDLSGQSEHSRIRLFQVFMPESVFNPLRTVLMSGFIGEGPKVEDFEHALRPWLGTPNILALNSGTSALQLALHLSEIGPGDEVISTPLTCVAMNLGVLHRHARIIWADVDPRTGNIDPNDVKSKINERTKAILTVHWGGDPCDIEAIQALAKPRSIKVIEDASHALGARYQGRPIGCHSDFVCFSFQAVKVLTTIDGGALTCRDHADWDRGRLLRWYGLDRRERQKRGIDDDSTDILEAGYKFHMHDVSATIGLEQLGYLKRNLASARANARRFDTEFRNLHGIRLLERRPGHQSSCWLYTLHVDNVKRFRRYMDQAGIDVSQVHVRNDKYRVFKDFSTRLPNLDVFTSSNICIPVGWWLSDRDIERVIEAVRTYDAANAPAKLIAGTRHRSPR